MKRKTMKKVISGMMALAMIAGTGVVAETGTVFDTGITVNAAQSKVQKSGEFYYIVKSDGTVKIIGAVNKKHGSNRLNIPEKINGKTVSEIGWGDDNHGGIFEDVKIVFVPSSVKTVSNCLIVGIPYACIICKEGSAAHQYAQKVGYSWITTYDGEKKSGDYSYATRSDGTAIISAYRGKAKNLSIPDKIDGKKVTEIGRGAFIGSGLESVTVPKSVEYIRFGAFEGCKKLKKVVMYDGLKDIGLNAFFSDENLSSITVPKTATLSQNTFAGTKWLEQQKGDFVIAGAGCLIAYKGKASKVVIPSNVKVINNAFEYNYTNWAHGHVDRPEIKEIVIPKGVKYIWSGAFMGCTSVKEITIPDGVLELDMDVFSRCYSLKKVVIPKSVKTIYEDPFSQMYDALDELTVYGYQGSEAEKYCKSHNIRFSVLDTIALNKTQMSLGKGESFKLKATVSLTDKSVKWRTSASKILTVDQKGNVKAVGTGTAWITAKASDGKEKSCKITVKNMPTKISLSKGDFAMGVGETFTLSAVLPANTAAAKRTFRTSNSSIIKMNSTDWNGKFTAVKPGVAWVTVKLSNGVEKSCKITVRPAPTNVYLNKKTLKLKVGQTAKVSAYLNNGAASAARTYRSSNSSIVKMTRTNWEGQFKAVKLGTAWVTVRTFNGREASCKVTVVK